MNQLEINLARLEEKHIAVAEALVQHERVCGDRYNLILKVIIGSTVSTIGGLGAIALMLLEKIL